MSSFKDEELAMSRMNWLWALRPLFDSLQAFNSDIRKRHVEKANFLEAMTKVKPTLDLKPAQQLSEVRETEITYATAYR